MKRPPFLRTFLCCALMLLQVQDASGAPGQKSLVQRLPEVRGHLKGLYVGSYSDIPDARLANEDRNTLQQALLDVRLNTESSFGNGWSSSLQVEALGQATEPTSRAPVEGGFTRQLSLLDDQTTLFDLSYRGPESRHGFYTVRFDRAWLRYSSNQVRITTGRQALSWGSGMFFHPADFVNPFTPLAVDKEYKTARDLLSIELREVLGLDSLEFVALPGRRTPLPPGNQRNRVTWDASTLALRARRSLPEAGVDLESIIAVHRDEVIATAGLSTSLLEAVMRAEVVATHQDDGDTYWQAVANIDRSFVIEDRNVYLTAEYFYNGYGTTDGAYLSLSADAVDKLQRGELFVLARHYLALAAQVELSPLTRFTFATIANLEDASALLQPRISHSLSQNVDLLIGYQGSVGSRGDEFVGIPFGPSLSGNPNTEQGFSANPLFLTPGHQMLVKLSYYF